MIVRLSGANFSTNLWFLQFGVGLHIWCCLVLYWGLWMVSRVVRARQACVAAPHIVIPIVDNLFLEQW